MCITTEVKLVKKMLFLCATLVENLQQFLLMLFTRKAWREVSGKCPLCLIVEGKNRAWKGMKRKFVWGNNERFWIWQKKIRANKGTFFFFPVRAHRVYPEVGKWGSSINNWEIFVQARTTHNSLSDSRLPWGRTNVIFQTLSAFHIIFFSGITEKFTLFSLWPNCAVSNVLLNYKPLLTVMSDLTLV